MQNKKLLISIFIISISLLVLHLCALVFFFYWKYWWFDNIMHFLGGLTISIILIYYAERFGHLDKASRYKFLFFAMLGTLMIAVLWEIFEFKNNLAGSSESYALDTTLDLLFGMVGALCGALYGYAVRIKDAI